MVQTSFWVPTVSAFDSVLAKMKTKTAFRGQNFYLGRETWKPSQTYIYVERGIFILKFKLWLYILFLWNS